MNKILVTLIVVSLGFFDLTLARGQQVAASEAAKPGEFPASIQGKYVMDASMTAKALSKFGELTPELRSKLMLQGFPAYIDILPDSFRDKDGITTPATVTSITSEGVAFKLTLPRPGGPQDFRITVDPKGIWISSERPLRGFQQRYSRR
jgi:hypothetical protein